MKLKLLITILSLLTLTSLTQAESFKAITSLTTSGDTSGGIRYDLENGTVIDAGLTRDESSTQFWADAYYYNWGVYAAGTTKELSSIALMYAVEQSINENIAIGIGTKVINRNAAEKIEYFKSWDAYLVLGI